MNNLFNLKSFFKFLSRNKIYTIIDVFGLSVSLMFVILIAVYTSQELSTDSFQANADRLCVVASEGSDATAVPVAYRLQERYPEIEKVCPVIPNLQNGVSVYYGEKKFSASLLFADSTFFDVFSFKLIEGNRATALNDSYSAVISEKFAKTMFGSEEPVGKSIRLSDSTSVVVSAVMKDIDHSVIPYHDILLSIDRVTEFNASLSKSNYGNAGATIAFLLMRPGTDLQPKTTDILSFLKTFLWTYQLNFNKEAHVIPLRQLYFMKYDFSQLNHGDKNFVWVLMSVGILILIFSILNYINLTVAQAGQRAKEMATRRLLGSSRKDLFIRLMMEATLLTFISFLIGLFLAKAVLPTANNLLQTKINLMDVCSPAWIGGSIVLILLIGALAGMLPSILISAAKPIEVVRGTFRRRTKMVFSKFFITFQNAITMIMLVASITMIMQINHMIKAPLGYNTKNIIVTYNVFNSASEWTKAEEELRQQPFVKNIGFTNGTPFEGTNNLSGTYEGKTLSFQQMMLDSTAFNMLNLKIKQDNHVANAGDSIGWFLTEKAFRDMDIAENAPSFKIGDEKSLPILGVIKDFHLRNIAMETSPVMLRIKKHDMSGWNMGPWNILIEVHGDPAIAYKKVSDIYEKITGVEFNGKFLDQSIQESFEQQMRLSKIVGIFTAIAILISLLGLLAMSTYFIHQRSQEVAVRKVFGSDSRMILKQLILTFMNYVLIAFVIATPVAWIVMNHWLSNYSYRISLSPLIFVTAGAFCLLISFAAVFFQSWNAANRNPVESIKDNN